MSTSDYGSVVEGTIELDKQRSEPVLYRDLPDLLHFFNRDMVAPPGEIGVPFLKFKQHGLGKTGKKLAGGNIHIN
ncbi:MAG TPA: hypothetical protein V6C50_07855, partial [Crinalium sp.]